MFADELDVGFVFGNREAARFQEFQSFSIATVENDRLLQRLKSSLTAALREGKSFADWKKTANTAFDEAGVSRLKPYHLDTVWRTNSALAYSAGQIAELERVKDDFPYWQYSAVMDSRTRPSHKILHGKYFKTGDYRYFPPLGFRCRCSSIPISRRRAESLGITAPSPVTPQMRAVIKNDEFIGNKNQKFLNWLKRQSLSGEAKARVSSAVKRFSAEMLTYEEALKYVNRELQKEDFKNLYSEIETLVAENKLVNERDDALIRRLLTTVHKGRAIPLAALSDEIQGLYKTSVRVAYISDETLLKQIVKRQSQPIQFKDYFRIQEVIDKAEIVVEQSELRYLFIKEGNGYYVLALKSTQTQDEMYIQTFYFTSQEKEIERQISSGKVIKDLREK